MRCTLAVDVPGLTIYELSIRLEKWTICELSTLYGIREIEYAKFLLPKQNY